MADYRDDYYETINGHYDDNYPFDDDYYEDSVEDSDEFWEEEEPHYQEDHFLDSYMEGSLSGEW